MRFVHFTSGEALTRAVAWKFLSGGLFLFAIGLLILLFPLILAVVVAAFCFIAGLSLVGIAWRIFWTARPIPPGRKAEDAVWREIE